MRRRTWIVLAATTIAALGALAVGEGMARTSLSARLADAVPDGVALAPAGIVLWGLVSGSMPVTLTMGEDTIANAMTENAPEGQDAQIQGIRIDEQTASPSHPDRDWST